MIQVIITPPKKRINWQGKHIRTVKELQTLGFNLSLKMKNIISNNINALNHTNQGANHDTPPLINHLHRWKLKGLDQGDYYGTESWVVDMQGMLPNYVNYGTNPHPQPNNYTIKNMGVPFEHPGSRPTLFWERSLNEFNWSRKANLDKTRTEIKKTLAKE